MEASVKSSRELSQEQGAGWLYQHLGPADPLYGWLTDPASLTARIVARSESFSVHVISHRLARPHRDEASLLGLRDGELAWLREVLLVANGTPVVYARSVLPRDGLRGAWHMFGGIGQRPLGAALFADPLVSRGPLVARRLGTHDTRYHRARRLTHIAATYLWARRSVFMRHGEPLIVCEIFLPAIGKLAV